MIQLYLISLCIGLVLDAIWLGTVMRPFYLKQIGYLFNDGFLWWAAALFYLLFTAGLLFFVLQPALEKNSLLYAAGAGAFLGLLCYSTYNLTNQALIKDWPLIVTIVDTAWGTFFGGTVSVLSFVICKRFL